MIGKKNKLNNRGMTLLETMVAFLLLIIITLSFLGIIQFSSKMTMDAEDRRTMAEELDEIMARKDPSEQELISGSVILTLDTSKTSAANVGYDSELELGKCKSYRLDYPTKDAPEITLIRFKYTD